MKFLDVKRLKNINQCILIGSTGPIILYLISLHRSIPEYNSFVTLVSFALSVILLITSYVLTISASYRQLFVANPQYLTSNKSNDLSIFPYILNKNRRSDLKLEKIIFATANCYSIEKVAIYGKPYNLTHGANKTDTCQISESFGSDLYINIAYKFDSDSQVADRFIHFTIYYELNKFIGYKEFHKIPP